MKNLLLLIFFIPLCIACKKEKVGIPLKQYHFLNLIDKEGSNLFESNQISTSDFFYVSGDNKDSWEELIADKNEALPISEVPEPYKEIVADMMNNENLLLEHSQGHLDRERIVSINGVEYKFRFSPLKDGFYQDGAALQYQTDTIDHLHLYLHHIVLEDY